MRFPKAFSGVKKIWLAAILMLLAAALGIAILVVAAANATVNGEEVEISETVAAVIGSITIVMALIALVAFILNLVGLISARKDEDSFKSALLFTLLGIAASVVSSVWSGNSRLVRSMDLVNTLCKLFASYYILTGIANLAGQYPDTVTKAMALKSRQMIVYTFCATAVFKCIITLFNIQDGSAIHSILALVALVLEIASIVLYLRALSRGKQMLAK